jgi:hypothetical protein
MSPGQHKKSGIDVNRGKGERGRRWEETGRRIGVGRVGVVGKTCRRGGVLAPAERVGVGVFVSSIRCRNARNGITRRLVWIIQRYTLRPHADTPTHRPVFPLRPTPLRRHTDTPTRFPPTPTRSPHSLPNDSITRGSVPGRKTWIARQ